MNRSVNSIECSPPVSTSSRPATAAGWATASCRAMAPPVDGYDSDSAEQTGTDPDCSGGQLAMAAAAAASPVLSGGAGYYLALGVAGA